MGAIDIVDAHEFLDEHFSGEILAAVDTRNPDSLRWVAIKLYRLDGGEGYLIHRTGCSVVYHTSPTGCLTSTGDQSGYPASVDDLPDDAVPCPVCKPMAPHRLDGNDTIRYEFTRHTLDVCSTADESIKRLTRMRERRSRRTTTFTSQPVRELLEIAASQDQEFAMAMPGHGRAVRAM